MKRIAILLLGIAPWVMQAQSPQADFTAEEATQSYYTYQFDNNLAEWQKDTTNTRYTWRVLLNSTAKSTYLLIDPTATTALYIQGNGEQDETITSPALTVLQSSAVSWYAFFPTTKLDAFTFTFSVIEGNDTTTLFDAREWHAQNPSYSGADWAKLTFDLTPFTGKSVKFSYNYKGTGGSAINIAGFNLYQSGLPNLKAKATLGNPVHFVNRSIGEGLSYAWEFDGGTPSVSTEENPVVTYDAIGSYNVKLTVTNANGTDVLTKYDFVEVGYRTPLANADVVPVGYYTATACVPFVSGGTKVTLKDMSTNNPQYWSWTLMDKSGNVVGSSSEQNPTFVLNDLTGTTSTSWYRYSLIAGNDAGETSYTSGTQSIGVGGSQYVWNFEPAVKPASGISLPPLDGDKANGYYGANTKGITRWAEYFEAPLDSMALTQVALYMGVISPCKPYTQLNVYIAAADKDGKPGPYLGPVTKSSGDFTKCSRYTATQSVKFDFSSAPILLNHPFFIIFDGIAEYAAGSNEVAFSAVERATGEKNTLWVYQNGEWKQNSTPASLALMANVSYAPSNISKAIPIPGAYIPSPFETGDVNGDGTVDVSDVNAVISVVLGKAQASDLKGNADVNGDGSVDVSDVNAIIGIVLGK
ncbi:MAG: PKD domain-containing protein [Muribaculaceae bacterium]|nr:PKD domain-containing protein [Muribaculaceae bacterium]